MDRRAVKVTLDILTSLGVDHIEDIETSVPNIRAHLTDLNPTAADRHRLKL